MIGHTCFKCKRGFELDPVMVGFELKKLKKRNPAHYQAICPACRTVNKVAVGQIQSELDGVADEVQTKFAEYEEEKAKAKAERQAKAREKAAQQDTGKKSGKAKAKK